MCLNSKQVINDYEQVGDVLEDSPVQSENIYENIIDEPLYENIYEKVMYVLIYIACMQPFGISTCFLTSTIKLF